MSVNALGYLSISTPRREEWRTFAAQLLGMQLIDDPASDTSRLRLDDRGYRVELVDADTEAVNAIGWQVLDRAALDAVVDTLSAAGHPVIRCDADTAARRGVSALARMTDPAGFELEFFYGQKLAGTPFVSPVGARFVTGDFGMGHVVFLTAAFDEQLRFYTETLGSRVSDTLTMGPSRVVFMRCNPRHHSVALLESPGDSALHHFMVELADLNMVGRGWDTCRADGREFSMDLGRHSNDEMVSFYVTTPSGFAVEYGWGGLLVDDATWSVTELAGPSVWGHQMLKAPI